MATAEAVSAEAEVAVIVIINMTFSPRRYPPLLIRVYGKVKILSMNDRYHNMKPDIYVYVFFIVENDIIYLF